jgi:hypothetical protein
MLVPFVFGVVEMAATLVSALPTNMSPATEFTKRNDICGYYFDTALGDSTGNYIRNGGNVCLSFAKPNERPNQESQHTLVIDSPACIGCLLYT